MSGSEDFLAIEQRAIARESARYLLLGEIRFLLWPNVALILSLVYLVRI